MIIEILARVGEKQKTFSAVDNHVFQWFIMYQLANVFLLVAAGSVFSSITDAVDDPSSIVSLLGTALPQVSVFFINFTITKLLVGVPMLLLRIGPLVVFQLLKVVYGNRLTNRQLLEGPLCAQSVPYGVVIPTFLYVALVMVIYWVIAPILLGVCTLFFGFSYLAWKRNFLYVIKRKYESGGIYWYGLYGYTMSFLIVSAITMLGYFSIKLGAAQAPLTLPLPFIIILVWRQMDSKFKVISENLPFSTAVDIDNVVRLSDGEIVASFKCNYLTQPSVKDPNTTVARPHRIEDVPLLCQKGSLNAVYYQYLTNPGTGNSDVEEAIVAVDSEGMPINQNEKVSQPLLEPLIESNKGNKGGF